jgi:ribulose-phosphate 3-epimerase
MLDASKVKICPTVTAQTIEEFNAQIDNVKAFSDRLHIDLMDGLFAPSESPDLESIELPKDMECDIHLMYEDPQSAMQSLVRLNPKLVIIHFEAEVDHESFASELKRHGIKVGIALLQTTPFEVAETIIEFYDHVLIFSGRLGYHGGEAQLGLLKKVKLVKEAFPDKELAWDGGINPENTPALIESGIEVLNVGGYIQSAIDPAKAYANIEAAI